MNVNLFLLYLFFLDTIYTSGLWPKMMIEMFICAICCPPYFDFVFTGTMLAGIYTYRYFLYKKMEI